MHTTRSQYWSDRARVMRAVAQYRLDKENDALKALEGLGPRVAGRLSEQRDDLREGVLQFGHLPMFGTGAWKFRVGLFADTGVTAQATRRQEGVAQIAEQALGQVLTLLWCRLLECMHGIGDQSDGMGETEAIAIYR